ncbi:HK97 family phage prohead protease [Clostridium perfringens]|uniref:HK97 family phage prohead protease n=1 Tax=Clostridium perfringens TaxID=1502 RepID=UPI0013E400FD|nr:HK97 family phage prohead protease [Clostridium perfringens]NGU14605.1 HK97 family phage prohead protease [Clostridium perfringens]NGY67380.1 HK97 family phage prohead protease [Clostridium perfringens]
MKLNFRSNGLELEGYINVTERPSEILSDKDGQFIEVVKRGCWKRALSSNKTIDLLYNHNPNRKIGDNKTNLELMEDSIGLKFRALISDPDIIAKAKEGKLKNCSFGFIPKRTSKEFIGGIEHRNLYEIELYEVSLLDIPPAYSGCSIYKRDLEGSTEEYETRSIALEVVEEVTEEKIKEAIEELEEVTEEVEESTEEPTKINHIDVLKQWLWLQQQL